MLKQSRRNVVLLVILSLLVALLAWLPASETDRNLPRLLASPPTDIRVFQRMPDGSDSMQYHLYLEDGKWWIEGPNNEPQIADPMRAESAQQALLAPSRRSWKKGEIDPAETGLAQPRHRIEADGQSLWFGGRGALGNQRYATDGDRILLISDIITYHLQRDASSFLPPQQRSDDSPED